MPAMPTPAARVPNDAGAQRVDASGPASVSFAPVGRASPRPIATSSPTHRNPEGHALIGVGPGLPGSVLRAGLVTSYPFPITGTKIHPPLLRPDTLSRPRLTDWLDKAARGRVALIIAEAGFGKTTLLADWASRSPRRTAWYRLEPDDSDWLTFLRHLVASGRELDPDFGTDTLEMLLALGSGGPGQDDIIATLVHEFLDFGAALPDGLTLIFDDYHAIDASPETQVIVQALVDRTCPDFSIVIASRSAPTLPLGRLRARGALSRLEGDDLCFDVPETDRLFREAYHRPLDPDVVAELNARTDGWAALLTLVRTSIEDKDGPEARALVAQLSSARGDLYDFLAEEVLATLSPALQRFLTRASILVAVDPETGAVVNGSAPEDLVPLITEAEVLGLLTRPDREAPHRFHPLVQGFLAARLTNEVGDDAVRALHRRVAVALEASDWLGAAWHYRAAADPDDAARVIDAAVPSILAGGGFELAAPFLDGSAGPADRPAALILRSRLELGRGSLATATELGQRSVERARDSSQRARGAPQVGTALLNLASLLGIAGYEDDSVRLAKEALAETLTESQSVIAHAIVELRLVSQDGDLERGAERLMQLSTQHRRDGMHRYAAITLLNLASALEWLGRVEEALEAATEAEAEITTAGSPGVELRAIMASRAGLLTLLGRAEEADQILDAARDVMSQVARDEAALEAARIKAAYGSRGDAEAAFSTLDLARLRGGYIGLHALISGEIAIRRRDLSVANDAVRRLRADPCHDTAGRLREYVLRARVALLAGSPTVERELAEARRICERTEVSTRQSIDRDADGGSPRERDRRRRTQPAT